MLTLRTHDIMIFGGMNGKLASENFLWKWISRTEEENDEMGISNSRERSRLKKVVKQVTLPPNLSNWILIFYQIWFINILTSALAKVNFWMLFQYIRKITNVKKIYSPVSIVSNHLSKTYEELVYNQLYDYFDNILLASQCGFRKWYSPQHCLLVIIKKFKEAIDRGNIQLCKAFVI